MNLFRLKRRHTLQATPLLRTISSIFILTLTACGGGGGGASNTTPAQATTPVVDTNIIPVSSSQISGKIIFAAGARASVFWDDNQNWKRDPWETAVDADENGAYIIPKSSNKDAILRAETFPGSSDLNGLLLNTYVLSATADAPEILSPFSTLQQASGQNTSQLESKLGLIQGSSLDVNNPNAQLAGSVISIQLVNRLAEFQNAAATDAASGILYYTPQILTGYDFSGNGLQAINISSTPLSTTGAISKRNFQHENTCG